MNHGTSETQNQLPKSKPSMTTELNSEQTMKKERLRRTVSKTTRIHLRHKSGEARHPAVAPPMVEAQALMPMTPLNTPTPKAKEPKTLGEEGTEPGDAGQICGNDNAVPGKTMEITLTTLTTGQNLILEKSQDF